MAKRQSHRLQGLPAEIETTSFRPFCLEEGDVCETSTMQLPCCRQFLHRICCLRWRQTNHPTCPMCRDRQHQPLVPPPPPQPVEINQDIIARLRTLLDAPDLEQQLRQVRYFFYSHSLSLSPIPFLIGVSFLVFRSLLHDHVVNPWPIFTFCFNQCFGKLCGSHRFVSTFYRACLRNTRAFRSYHVASLSFFIRS